LMLQVGTAMDGSSSLRRATPNGRSAVYPLLADDSSRELNLNTALLAIHPASGRPPPNFPDPDLGTTISVVCAPSSHD